MNAANVIPLSAPQPFDYGKSASPAALNPSRVRFGPFELDEANARLSRDGTAVTLAPRPFGLLCALARRPGSLLTKHTLLDAVWGHRFVSESVLRTAISDLRTVLDDDPRRPRFIETESRHGYRFIAATTAIPSTAAIASAAPVREIDFSGQPSFKNGSEAPPRPRGAGRWAAVASVPLYRLFERSTRRSARRVVLSYHLYSRRWKKCVTLTNYGCN